jgi:hypothetical protein
MELVQRHRQFNGFRQVWTERTDGVFHGLYTVFWESGDVPCMQGEYKDGAQNGIWTYWDRSGTVERQVHFANDEELDSRMSAPWFGSVALR